MPEIPDRYPFQSDATNQSTFAIDLLRLQEFAEAHHQREIRIDAATKLRSKIESQYLPEL